MKAETAAIQAERDALIDREMALENAYEIKEKQWGEKDNELRSMVEELTAAVAALDEVLDAVESGEAEVVNGKLRMPKWPSFISRMAQGTAEGQALTPVTRIVLRFLRLLGRQSDLLEAQRAKLFDDAPRLGD